MLNVIKELNKLLSHREKIKTILITILMVAGAFLETIGISLVVPLVTAITQPKLLEENELVHKVSKIFRLQSINSFIVWLIIVLILLFAFKNLFLYFEYQLQYRFVYNYRFNIQKKLLNTYLHQPYEYFISVQTGELIRVMTIDVVQTTNLLIAVLNILTEGIVALFIISVIFIIDPMMTLIVAFIMGITTFLILKCIKPVLKKAGFVSQKSVANSNKWLLQAINGIKEVKVLNKERFFLKKYQYFSSQAIGAERKNSVLGTLPRLLIEAICICAMLLIILCFILTGRELDTMLPQLSAFAMAAVRLMPSANRINSSLNLIPYMEPALIKLLDNLWGMKEKEENVSELEERIPLTLTDKITISNISYSYPENNQEIFSNASMEIPVGASVGIIGASGAGKTTIVDILLGLLKPQEGQILSDGIDICKNYAAWLSYIAYIPQMIFMLDDTIKANIAFGFDDSEIDEEKVWNVLKDAKLEEYVKTLPKGIETEIGERGIRLSGGQRQRIGIARALYSDSELLVFDEATSALDNETEEAIMDSIRSLHGKKTIIMIAHRLTTIEGCDFIYKVIDKKIVKQ